MASSREEAGEFPFYIFYANTTTGRDVNQDHVIEVAAHTISFCAYSSLCHCDKELHQDVLQNIGTTIEKLRQADPLQRVLQKFIGWIKHIKDCTDKILNRKNTPVLVAHGGKDLEFPMLFKEVNSSPMLSEQMKSLGLCYVDTHAEFEARRVKDLFYTVPSIRFSNCTFTGFQI